MENGVSFAVFFFAILVYAKNCGVVNLVNAPIIGQMSYS